MLTLGNWEIALSLLTGGTKCIRLDFILQIQLNSTGQEIHKEKESVPHKEKEYSGIASKEGKHDFKKHKLVDFPGSSSFFPFSTTGSSLSVLQKTCFLCERDHFSVDSCSRQQRFSENIRHQL